MASIMTKRGSQDNVATYEHICDNTSDMASIEDKYATLGSTCIVLNGGSGGMEVYIADSDHQWQSLAIAGASGGSGSTIVVDSSPLFHVCTPSEVNIRRGTPKITSPEENTIYLVPIIGETNNVCNEYLYVNGEWEMIGSAGIDLSEYVTYQDLDNADYATYNDLDNYASLDSNGKISMEQLPLPAITSSDNDKVLKVKSGNWAVENEVDISGKVDKTYEIDFEPKTWNGLTYFLGSDIWTDGKNIYYSSDSKQYVLDKSTSTWTTTTWNGMSNLDGQYVWTDGENIYYSQSKGSKQYVLDISTSTWSPKTWNGLTNPTESCIWTDGENIYYSNDSEQYILDRSTSTWSQKTWNGLTSFSGDNIWKDGETIYYSYPSPQHYVLDKSTSTWNPKTWYGREPDFGGREIWTAEGNIYSSIGSEQYVLDKTTSTWNPKTWNDSSNLFGKCVWSDGENTYYSEGSQQYVLEKDDDRVLLGNNGTFSPVSIEKFTKLLTQELPCLPEAPSTDGTYTLQVTVTNGTPTYSWTSLSSLSGVTF